MLDVEVIQVKASIKAIWQVGSRQRQVAFFLSQFSPRRPSESIFFCGFHHARSPKMINGRPRMQIRNIQIALKARVKLEKFVQCDLAYFGPRCSIF